MKFAYPITHRVQQITPKVSTLPRSIGYETNMGKGAILKHKTLAMATCSNMYGLALPEDGILMSYLPLAHIYEVLLGVFLVRAYV